MVSFKHRSELMVAMVAVIVAIAALWVAYAVPRDIDEAARLRERNRICVESVIDLRAALDRIETGYLTTPDTLPARLADWDSGENAIERTRVSCRDVTMPTARNVEQVRDLWEQYHTERDLAKRSTPPLEVVTAIRKWTTASIRDITA